MKFLVTIDDSYQPVEMAFVTFETQQRWTERYVGKEVEAIYSLAGGHGAIMIVDVDSHEQLDELMINSAACNGAKIRIEPLADYRVAMKNLEGRLSKIVSRLKATHAEADPARRR